MLTKDELDRACAEVSRGVYAACVGTFERLELAGAIVGNGHHAAQQLGARAAAELRDRITARTAADDAPGPPEAQCAACGGPIKEAVSRFCETCIVEAAEARLAQAPRPATPERVEVLRAPAAGDAITIAVGPPDGVRRFLRLDTVAARAALIRELTRLVACGRCGRSGEPLVDGLCVACLKIERPDVATVTLALMRAEAAAAPLDDAASAAALARQLINFWRWAQQHGRRYCRVRDGGGLLVGAYLLAMEVPGAPPLTATASNAEAVLAAIDEELAREDAAPPLGAATREEVPR